MIRITSLKLNLKWNREENGLYLDGSLVSKSPSNVFGLQHNAISLKGLVFGRTTYCIIPPA